MGGRNLDRLQSPPGPPNLLFDMHSVGRSLTPWPCHLLPQHVLSSIPLPPSRLNLSLSPRYPSSTPRRPLPSTHSFDLFSFLDLDKETTFQAICFLFGSRPRRPPHTLFLILHTPSQPITNNKSLVATNQKPVKTLSSTRKHQLKTGPPPFRTRSSKTRQFKTSVPRRNIAAKKSTRNARTHTTALAWTAALDL